MIRLPRQCRTRTNEAKRVFRTLAEAEEHLNSNPEMEAYFCTHCVNYHVGHKMSDKSGTRPLATRRQIRQALRKSRHGR